MVTFWCWVAWSVSVICASVTMIGICRLVALLRQERVPAIAWIALWLVGLVAYATFVGLSVLALQPII